MANTAHLPLSVLNRTTPPTLFAPVLVCVLIVVTSLCGQAQTYTVLHSFASSEGSAPYAGVTMDRRGSLYGTTAFGGTYGGGVVYRLSRSGANWILNPLYSFRGQAENDGANPLARVVFGPDGALYGTTSQGGPPSENCFSGCGTVFRLAPQANVCKSSLCPWNETQVLAFQGGSIDGQEPGYGDLVFDQAGKLYGTTIEGGGGLCNDSTCGTVYQLVRSGGGWTETLLPWGGSGYWPYPGVILDNAGNVYGATTWNFSSVFEITPTNRGWSPSTLYAFSNYPVDGTAIQGGLLLDQAGNVFGTTSLSGPNGGGTVFELTSSGGTWTLTTLYSFTGNDKQLGSTATLTADAAGNLYGITNQLGAHGYGNVFKLTRSGGGWMYSSIYDFTGGNDGGSPWGQLMLDSSGNLYGTTTGGGSHDFGVVFQITP